MTRHAQTDLVAAPSLRRPAEPHGRGAGTTGIVPESPVGIGMAVGQFEPRTCVIGHICLPGNAALGPCTNTPKHKSP